ncbi:MAG: hypothetical protein RR807_04515 [Oscillospiraceae bacterium]
MRQNSYVIAKKTVQDAQKQEKKTRQNPTFSFLWILFWRFLQFLLQNFVIYSSRSFLGKICASCIWGEITLYYGYEAEKWDVIGVFWGNWEGFCKNGRVQ